MHFKCKIIVLATDTGVPKAKLISVVLFFAFIDSVEQNIYFKSGNNSIKEIISIIKTTTGLISFKIQFFQMHKQCSVKCTLFKIVYTIPFSSLLQQQVRFSKVPAIGVPKRTYSELFVVQCFARDW